MRTLSFAAGICLAVSAVAAAGAEEVPLTQSDANITLTNGCVYMPNPFAQDNSWRLLYTETGTTTRCALTIYGQSAQVPEAIVTEALAEPAILTEPVIEQQPSQVSQAKTTAVVLSQTRRVVIRPGYLVGVFR